MGAKDLFTLADLALIVAENYGSTDNVTLEKAKRWINRALLRMNRFEWTWVRNEDCTFVTASGIEKYTLESGIKKIRSVYTKDPKRKLRLDHRRNLRWVQPDPAATSGKPTHYFIVGFDAACNALEIALFPVPDSAITVFVDAENNIPLLESDNDDIRSVSGVPEHFIDGVIDLATVFGFRELGDTQEDAAERKARLIIAEMQDYDSSEIDDENRHRLIGFNRDVLDPISDFDLT